MLAVLDRLSVGSTASSGDAALYVNSNGSEWHNNANRSISEFTSACLCKIQHLTLALFYYREINELIFFFTH
jgi:hypothetical protein